MNARETSRNVVEWIFRSAALRAARTALPDAGGGTRAAATRQAKLLLEIARRVAEPGEALPAGGQAAVLLGMYRDAIYWALAARRPEGEPPPADLHALWDASAPSLLAGSPPDNQDSAALRRVLFDDYDPRSLAVSDADAARAGAFAEALVTDLAAPRRRVEGILIQRWLRVGLAAGVVLVLALAVRALLLGPNLAAGKPFRVSSSFSGWASCVADNGCHGLMFHTETEPNPWVEIDLGAPKQVRRIEVLNRGDCCADRAVPLVAEVSTDRTTWTQVARTDQPFGSWKTGFPARIARYVRLRVARRSVLHLQAIAVR